MRMGGEHRVFVIHPSNDMRPGRKTKLLPPYTHTQVFLSVSVYMCLRTIFDCLLRNCWIIKRRAFVTVRPSPGNRTVAARHRSPFVSAWRAFVRSEGKAEHAAIKRQITMYFLSLSLMFLTLCRLLLLVIILLFFSLPFVVFFCFCFPV